MSHGTAPDADRSRQGSPDGATDQVDFALELHDAGADITICGNSGGQLNNVPELGAGPRLYTMNVTAEQVSTIVNYDQLEVWITATGH